MGLINTKSHKETKILKWSLAPFFLYGLYEILMGVSFLVYPLIGFDIFTLEGTRNHEVTTYLIGGGIIVFSVSIGYHLRPIILAFCLLTMVVVSTSIIQDGVSLNIRGDREMTAYGIGALLAYAGAVASYFFEIVIHQTEEINDK